MTAEEKAQRIDRLLDAIELIQANRKPEALVILRALIGADKDFEDAWLWMSLAVETVDQSVVCLDNVLRINPNNLQASGALYRLRESEMRSESLRARLRSYRDMSAMGFFVLMIMLLFAVLITSATMLF